MPTLPTTDISIDDINVALGNTASSQASLNDTKFRDPVTYDVTTVAEYDGGDGINPTANTTVSIGEYRGAIYGVPSYTIQGSDPLTVSEVASAQTITVNTTNVPDTTVLYWNITTDEEGTTQASTDWQAYNSGGTGFTINSNTGSFTIDATADAFTDGSTETFYLHVRTGSDTGTSVDFITLNVTDDSLTQSSLGIAASDTTPQEGDTITFTPSNTVGAPSATYYFGIEYTGGTPAADANFTVTPPKSGSRTTLEWDGTNFTPSTVQVTLEDLYTIDQGKTFTAGIYTANTGGTAEDTVVCTIQEGPVVYNVSGSTSINEPTAGITYSNTTMNLLNASETETQNVTSVDTVDLDIQAGNSSSVSASSNTTGVAVTPSSVADFSAQTPDFTVSFANAADGVSYDVDFTDTDSTGSLQGTVTVVGNYTYTVDVTNLAQNTVLYWRVEDTGTVAISADDFFSGYTTGGAATGTSGGYLSGQVTCGTDTGTAYRGTFDVRLKDKQYGSNPDFKISLYSDSGYTNKVLDGLAGTAVGEITITSQSAPSTTVAGSTSLTEPAAGVSRTANFGSIDGVDHGSLNVNSLDDYTITIFPTDGNIGIISDTNCSAGSHNNVSGEYPVSSFKNAGGWSVVVEDTVTTVSETHSGAVTVVGENTYTVTTTNVVDGTYYYWELSDDTGTTFDATVDTIDGYNDNGVSTAHVGTALRGRVLINSNAGSFKVRLNHNAAQTGSPTCKLRLYQDSGYSTEVSNPTYPGTITIGAGAGQTYTIQGSDPLTVSEVASAQTITVNTTNVTNGTLLYWNITTDEAGTNEASTDWQAYNSGGTGFTINSNTGNFQIDATADAFTDGSTETFYLNVRTGSDTGTRVDYITLNVTDDSQSAAAVGDLISFPYSGFFARNASGSSVEYQLVFANNGTLSIGGTATTEEEYPWDGSTQTVDLNTTSLDTSGWGKAPSGNTFDGNDYQFRWQILDQQAPGLNVTAWGIDSPNSDAANTWKGGSTTAGFILTCSDASQKIRTLRARVEIATWDGLAGNLGSGTIVLEKEFNVRLQVF